MSENRPPSGEPIETEPSQAKPATRAVPALDNEGVVWDPLAPSQVMRTVAVALLTAAVVLGGLFLLWQVRTFIGWFVIALFLAAVLNPIVNWLQRRHRMVKRSLAIVLTYLGVLVALLLILGIGDKQTWRNKRNPTRAESCCRGIAAWAPYPRAS
jgi:hypothetical protein